MNEKDSGATRRRLIEATLDLLAEKGSDALRTREILERAGVSNMSAVSYHFGSLEELRRQALDTYFAAMREVFASLETETTPREALLSLCRRFAAFVDRNPALERNIVFHAMYGKEVDPTFALILGDNLLVLRTLIARGKGGVTDDSVAFDAIAFASALIYPLLLRRYGKSSVGLSGDDNAAVEAYFTHLVNLVLGPPSTKRR
jgi:AcrR family transcriptional regulator